MQERLEALTVGAAKRPRATLAVAILLAIAGGLLALGLRPSAATDTFVSRSSATFRATAEDQRHFGSDAIVILVREPLTDLVETKDLGIITQLEACLAGQTVVANQTLGSFVPGPAATPAYGGSGSPCGWLKRNRPARVVFGPGTFLSRAVEAVNQQVQGLLADTRQTIATRQRQAYELAIGEHLSRSQAQRAAQAAGTLASQQATEQLERIYLNSGINGLPRIDDPQFIPQVVFDRTRGVNQPKARFAYLFPSSGSALIQVRLRANLDPDQQAAAIRQIRAAVQMPRFHLSFGGTYTVSGAPVVVNDLTAKITGSITLLLLVAVGVMAVVLALVFRRRLRLLPLGVALIACGITFGLMALVGGSLTMASIAVVPILIGLAVDYAIQFQSRLAEGSTPLNVSTLATAAAATAAGFLMLVVSPVPMVRGFGLLLVVGVIIALLCALTVVPAALALSRRPGGPLAASWRGAADLLGVAATRLRPEGLPGRRGGASGDLRSPPRPLRWVLRAPGRVLAIAGVLAVVGWVADTGTAVQSDVTKLVPANMPALRDLHTLERITGVSGELDVLVRARDVTDPAVVAWMTSYEQTLLAHYGYLETKGCAVSTLCPALSLPDLFSTGAGGQGGTSLNAAQIRGLLAAVPAYFSQAVITPGRREATLAFGIRLMPLARQQRVLDYMRAQLHPPAGVEATLTGLPVLAAQANAELSSAGRRLLITLLGLLAVAAVLLAILRRRRRALVPLVPILLATGWSSLVLHLIGIPLNPMSATLGTLVIAISTEFSVLLAERFREERAVGVAASDALSRTYRSTGRAVLASGITAIAGFAVLICSDITMLRDFGFVTVVDLAVSLGGVLLVLPAVLMLAQREPVQRGSQIAGHARLGLRLRRRPRVAES